jgi:O-antigen ligase
MIPALYFTNTRSALLAVIIGLAALFLLLKNRIRSEIVIACLFVVIVAIELIGLRTGVFLGGRSEDEQLGSSQSRPILWQAGIAIAMDNPLLGIGTDQFILISPEYVDSVDEELIEWEEERYWSYRTLGSVEPHNDFLNIWVSYGIFALITYLWLYVAIMRNLLESYWMSSNRFLRGISVGLAAALVAYGVNAFYHNLLTTMPLFWILAGCSMITFKLATKESDAGPKAIRQT